MNEMNRLKAAIIRQYEDDQDYKIEVHNPRNTETLSLFFRGQKTAKVIGQLAKNIPPDNSVVSGILLRRNFNYHLLMPSDLNVYTELSISTLTQKKSLYYDGELALLIYNLGQLSEDYKLLIDAQTENGSCHVIQMFQDTVKISYFLDQKVVVLEWTSTPVTDMYSDALMAVILHAQMNPIPLKRNLILI
jgi:cleavage and polyadenylation specificity factor subunit 3